MIKFEYYAYSDFYNNITRWGSYIEEDIETGLINAMQKSSKGNLDIIKSKHTDGVIRYVDDKGKEVLFLQEVKNGKRFTGSITTLSQQFAQAIYYYFYDWVFRYGDKINFKGIIFPTEKYYAYVKVKEVKDFLEILKPLYLNTKVKSACHIKEDKTIIELIKTAITNNSININYTKFTESDDLAYYFDKAIN